MAKIILQEKIGLERRKEGELKREIYANGNVGAKHVAGKFPSLGLALLFRVVSNEEASYA